MLSIGWRPLADPGGAWPSGLALGPYGSVMSGAFLVSGLCFAYFALGLQRGLPPGSRVGPALLFVSGVSVSLLAFETDPIVRTGPRSIPGFIHDAAFVVFALTLLVGLMFLSRRMRADALWVKHSRYTLATGLLAAACLFLPGIAYYGFIALLMAWITATALKLRQIP